MGYVCVYLFAADEMKRRERGSDLKSHSRLLLFLFSIPLCPAWMDGWTDGWRSWSSERSKTGRGDQLEYKEQIAFSTGQYESQCYARRHGEDEPWGVGWEWYSRDDHSTHTQVKAKTRQQVLFIFVQILPSFTQQRI